MTVSNAALVPLARRLFDLDADAEAIVGHLAKDPGLRKMLSSQPPPRVPGCWDPLELAVRAILGQQISVRGAATLAARIVAQFGGRFPTAAELASADLTAIGLTKSRIASLRALGAAVADGQVRFDPSMELGEAVEQFKTVRGIGDWTAHYIAMRALKNPDAFLAGDLFLRRAFPDILRRAERWKPYRAYAAIVIWTGATR